MPFTSDKQRRWMFKAAEKGEIAKDVLKKFRAHPKPPTSKPSSLHTLAQTMANKK